MNDTWINHCLRVFLPGSEYAVGMNWHFEFKNIKTLIPGIARIARKLRAFLRQS